MSRLNRGGPAAEVHLRIGRLVIDAQAAGGVDAHEFTTALQTALAERLDAGNTGTKTAPRRLGASEAIADAVAARVKPRLSPTDAG